MRTENPDSIELGTPSKGVKKKIYGDFSKPEEFKDKIDNAKDIEQYALEKFKKEGKE